MRFLVFTLLVNQVQETSFCKNSTYASTYMYEILFLIFLLCQKT